MVKNQYFDFNKWNYACIHEDNLITNYNNWGISTNEFTNIEMKINLNNICIFCLKFHYFIVLPKPHLIWSTFETQKKIGTKTSHFTLSVARNGGTET